MDFNIDSTGGDAIYIHDSSGPLRLIDLDITGATNTALYIEKHDGTIEMNRVNVHDNGQTGAQIMNYELSDDSYNTGAITISNSSFDRNAGVTQYGGLAITTGGSVTLQGITVSDNLYGLHVIQASKVTIKNSVINGNTTAGIAGLWLAGQTDDPLGGDILLDNVVVNDNPYGVSIHTYGNITANKVVATGNTGFGGSFNTCGSSTSDCYPYYYGKVTINNSTFDDNGGPEMLRIWSRGAVALTNVSASGNATGAGALVHTQHSRLVTPVTITGGTFNDNATYGLEVLSKGTITLSKVKASGNLGGYGANLNNLEGTAGVVVKGTLAGDNAFDDNGSYGLDIQSNGAIALGYFTSIGNNGLGVNLANTGGTGGVTISNGIIYDNHGIGLSVNSKGAITLKNVMSNENYGMGAELHNETATGTPGVSITGSDFNTNQGTGLYVRSKGLITLKTTQAYENSVRNMAFPTGVYSVHDVLGPGGGSDLWTVEVDAGMVGIQYNVLLSSTTDCSFSYSGPGTGDSADCTYMGGYYEAHIFPVVFDAEGTWTFTLSSVNADDIGQTSYTFSTDVYGELTGDLWYDYSGADLDNTAGTTAGVSVTGAAFPKYDWGEDIPIRDFTANSGIGLKINSKGTITVNNVLAYKNGAKGAALDNTFAGVPATPAVNLSAGRFVYNGDTGLEVHTKGGITAKNIGAYENLALFENAEGYGTKLVTTTAGKVVSVINNNSTADNYIPGFENNAAGGLDISSLGAVTLTNVRAFDNENGHGIAVNSAGGTGNITLNNVSATYNTNGHGVLINNTTGSGNVTINTGYASDNTLDGFHIEARGAILLNKVYA